MNITVPIRVTTATMPVWGCDRVAEPIRILHVLATLNRGGAETMVMNLYRAMDRTQIQFDFVLHGQGKGDYDDEVRSLGGIINYVPRYSAATMVQYIQAWHRFLRDNRNYRIIHGHVRSTAAIYLTIAKKYGLTTIAHSHSTSSGTGKQALARNLLQIPLKGKLADYMFACTPAGGEWLFGRRNLPEVTIINNAIDAEQYAFNQHRRDQMRKALNIEQQLVLGHVGRFDQPKNHMFLIDIFKQLHSRDKNVILLLVGDGKLEQPVKEKVTGLHLDGAVKFLGLRSDVADLLQAMDVFVFPSWYEGIPLALIEAQAAGLPCIISDRISPEVAITPLVKQLPLSLFADRWAEEILSWRHLERESTTAAIKSSGYDIYEASHKLAELYLALP